MALILALLTSGLSALCCAQSRHAKRVLPWVLVPTSRRVLLLLLGWTALGLALWIAIERAGATLGTVWILALLPVITTGITLTINHLPRVMPCLMGLPFVAWMADLVYRSF